MSRLRIAVSEKTFVDHLRLLGGSLRSAEERLQMIGEKNKHSVEITFPVAYMTCFYPFRFHEPLVLLG